MSGALRRDVTGELTLHEHRMEVVAQQIGQVDHRFVTDSELAVAPDGLGQKMPMLARPAAPMRTIAAGMSWRFLPRVSGFSTARSIWGSPGYVGLEHGEQDAGGLAGGRVPDRRDRNVEGRRRWT
jgi:hypothetical protein